MKQRFISKKKKQRWKLKFLFFTFLFIFSICKTFKYLLKSNIKINDKVLVQVMLHDIYYKNNNNIIEKFLSNFSSSNLLVTNYYDIVPKTTKIEKKEEQKKLVTPNQDYLIYIYNTHQTEEYSANTFLEQEVRPTVMMASYIMEDVFNKNNYNTIVEERKISELLNQNNWKYYRSYDASRIFLNDQKKNNPNLKYFIDVHRDSLEKEKTTISINNKNYAKIIFLLGLENPNYQENYEFITKINNKLDEKYPNLSKGIYQKGGEGVNGVYNQDNSKYTLLIEIGGVDNTTDEVLNSTLAFTECFMEVISSNEG